MTIRNSIEQPFVTTLDGERTPKLHWCKSCRTHKPQVDFYVESKPKVKGFDDVRNICIPCYKEHNGKAFVPEAGTASLFEFLK